MKTLRMMFVLLAAGFVQAQGMVEVPAHPDFVTDWFANATAIEIEIPAGADTFAVQFGPDEFQPAMSTFLDRPPSLQQPGVSAEPDRLRLVIVPPEQPGGNGVCNRRSGQAVLFVAAVTPEGDTDHLHNLPFCVPYPDRTEQPDPTRFTTAITGQPVVTGKWLPVYLHAWLQDVTDPGGWLPVDQAFSVHVSFHVGNRSTHIPDELPPRIPELLELDEVGDALREL